MTKDERGPDRPDTVGGPQEAGTASDPAPAGAAEARPTFARRHWGKLALLTLIGVPLMGMVLWAAVSLSYTYSTGTRTGYVQKLSRKGWLCKTWEGELAMATAPGVPPQIFEFSVRNDSLARALSRDMGRGRISVEYDEHRGVPTSCFGETPHYVVSYQVVSEGGSPTFP
jgi:hypothetical protein